MNKRGFTLIELLVVIAILALLITLGSKGLRSARISAKKAQAMIEIKSIETAVKAYVNKYGKLPSAVGDDVVFDVYDLSREEPVSEAVISVLTVADDMIPEDNPARMVFLEPQGSGANGVFLDPWGYQYRIALDLDYDGRILIDKESVRRKVAVAAIGLFASSDATVTNDLVKSWQ